MFKNKYTHYLKTKNREIVSINLFWIASIIIFIFVIQNKFDISIIFTLLIPMLAFILLPRKKMLIHISIYFIILGIIFAYGYTIYEKHSLLYSLQNMSVYILALFFVIAFGIYYHIVIMNSYLELENENTQKTILLKEIHHRTKNNLNLVTSILGIQKLKSESKEVYKILNQNKLRLEAIAMAHEMLYIQDDLVDIDFKTYIIKLTQHILKSNENTDDIKLYINLISLKLSIEDIIQFGIIINELMTNSIKYAFENNKGTITIKLIHTDKGYTFYYNDNGVGLNKFDNPKGFGINLIEMTSQQLEATMTILNNNGLEYKLDFKGKQ